MAPRILLFIAMLIGVIVLLFVLMRWAESYRLRNQSGPPLALQTGLSASSKVGPLRSTQPSSAATPTPKPALFPLPIVTRRDSVAEAPLASKVKRYLGVVESIERERVRTWDSWKERMVPSLVLKTVPTPTPDPTAPERPVPDLLVEAARWERKLAGGLPDAGCLPFHLAYLHYLATEKDYIRRLAQYTDPEAQAEREALVREMEEVLYREAQQVQGKLHSLQITHPELGRALGTLEIR